ncbi:hypothetical protein T484DRAFT_1971092 [Baffinella frigidus]|nr:hypothetical protein T484DRAFT_1971092 [Cryptophyta sp. CCMP2293]
MVPSRLVLVVTMLASATAFAPAVPALSLRSPSSCRLQRAGPGRVVGTLRMQEQGGEEQYEQYAAAEAASPAVPQMSKREALMENVMQRQRVQDAERQRIGALRMESNRFAVILASSFIGIPVLALIGGFLAGAIPNPLEVCIEGGTSC